MVKKIKGIGVFTLGFQEVDKTKFELVGGKGANLGELSRLDGINVPEGFCITTKVYKDLLENSAALNLLLDQLAIFNAHDRRCINETAAKIRKLIREIPIPQIVQQEIGEFINTLGEKNAFAIRSSATAEDLPSASFAGQQDSYLNIIGRDEILQYISKCWASLFTERAVIYRIQNGFDHRKVWLSVIVQKMVFPEAAGILFTADPITSNRKVLSIDAGFGLGEAVVSGLVNADIYKVSNNKVVDKKVFAKKIAVHALKEGGTQELEIEAENQIRQVLTNEQILELADIGKKIGQHFNCPQDIEWCLADNIFYIVQSRPITTLFPIPVFPSTGLWQLRKQMTRKIMFMYRWVTNR